MKRISKMFMLVLGFVLILTGCATEESMTCTKTEESLAGTMDIEDVITFDGGYASKSVTTTVATFNSEDSANSYAAPYKNKNGIEVSQNGKTVTVIETTNLENQVNVTRDDLKEEYENDGWKCD